uniref:DUF6598 domain-containing protein n=1 Tax=Oryza rufipogon TaxID=4529 RepID=A0A0E0RK48_ORYRU
MAPNRPKPNDGPPASEHTRARRGIENLRNPGLRFCETLACFPPFLLQFGGGMATSELDSAIAREEEEKVLVPEASLYILNMVNVLAIRIDDGDVPFPIVVYGSVIARDDLDRKCIPLFARSRDDPQLIASKGHFYGKITACTSMVKDNILLHDSSLMPGGGVMAADHGNDQFVQLLRPVTAVYLHETLIVTILAQVDGTKYNRRTMYFKPAVNGEGEAQITCGVNSLLVKGHFYGRITACTSTVNDSILLHDSGLVPVGGGVMAADRGNDQFACVRRLRPVMAVCLQETMMVTVLAQVDGTEYNGQTMHFKPVVNGEGEARITCGVNSLLVKVWYS